jgi:hypothetical protein
LWCAGVVCCCGPWLRRRVLCSWRSSSWCSMQQQRCSHMQQLLVCRNCSRR